MKSTKLHDSSGYMLFESLIALALVSLSFCVLLPHAVQFFAVLEAAETEVAYWRVAQDQMRAVAKGGNPFGSHVSGGITFTTSWDAETAQLEISGNAGAERVVVHGNADQTEDR
ncbi:hypothetical protein [Trichococcus ilyis]|jgi:type II secretory pathway pseudopilin PulG|uniref:Uncharacterized protein n=1 Tax=Trichococcus ilyis TaxID=640938 RepID=A0A143YSS9_9LACT|nr:hypothetical protein [Trichococcus ilyis]CZQ97785.1 Hypothetical protein TR210_1504 [Trichococcus ilyis]SEJ20091.1 hypothetical protein SAMN05216375_10953 [Trichococcus ilyis]